MFMCVFPKKCEGAEELKYVFPTMQKQVQKVIDTAKNMPEIHRVIVFGSAVTMNCGIGSDLDVAIDAPEIVGDDEFIRLVRPIRRAIDVDADIIHYNGIRSPLLLREIDLKGVDVYVNRVR
jgi:predicted nucleotidyltransferase